MHVVMENYNRLNWSRSMYIDNLPATDTRLYKPLHEFETGVDGPCIDYIHY